MKAFCDQISHPMHVQRICFFLEPTYYMANNQQGLRGYRPSFSKDTKVYRAACCPYQMSLSQPERDSNPGP